MKYQYLLGVDFEDVGTFALPSAAVKLSPSKPWKSWRFIDLWKKLSEVCFCFQVLHFLSQTSFWSHRQEWDGGDGRERNMRAIQGTFHKERKQKLGLVLGQLSTRILRTVLVEFEGKTWSWTLALFSECTRLPGFQVRSSLPKSWTYAHAWGSAGYAMVLSGTWSFPAGRRVLLAGRQAWFLFRGWAFSKKKFHNCFRPWNGASTVLGDIQERWKSLGCVGYCVPQGGYTSSGSREGLGGPVPPCPQDFFKIMQFSCMLREKPLFWANFGLRAPILGVKTPLGKILDPRLYTVVWILVWRLNTSIYKVQCHKFRQKRKISYERNFPGGWLLSPWWICHAQLAMSPAASVHRSVFSASD